MNKELWEKAINSEVVVNCNSKNECDNYLYMCNKKKVAVANEVRDNAWKEYGGNVCFNISHNDMYFGSFQYFKDAGCEIITYTELMEDKKTFTGPELAQLLRDKELKEGTKFKDEMNKNYIVHFIPSANSYTLYCDYTSDELVRAVTLINRTFTLIEEPKLYFLNHAVKSNKHIKLKDWDNFHDIEQALVHLSKLSKETIQEAFTMKVWEVEE